jgi:hypothetical protein
MTLRRLTLSDSVDEALAEAAAREPERFATHIAAVDGVMYMLWDGDAGWPASDPHAPGARHRLVAGSTWRYENTFSS